MARIPLLLTLAALSLTAGPAPAQAAGTWSWPVRGDVITHYRNGADPYAGGQHRGIDIAAAVGRAVSAPTAGRVTFAGTAGSSGLTVSVRTADGRWDTSYLHLSSVSVREGDRVRAGRPPGSRGHHRAPVRAAAAPPLRDPRGGQPPRLPRPAGLPRSAGRPRPGQARPGRRAAAAAAQAAAGAAPVPAANRAPRTGPQRCPRARGRAGASPRPAPRAAGSRDHPGPGARGEGRGARGPSTRPRSARPRPRSRARAAGAAPAPAEPRQAKAPAPAPTGTVHAPANPRPGFDLGWALACLGVAAAALALGRPGRERGPRARFGTAALRVFGGWPTTSRPRSTT